MPKPGASTSRSAAVGLARSAGQQRVEGRVDRGRLRRVMRLAVGEGDDAGEARARHVRQRPLQRGEQARALVAGLRHLDGAELQLRQAARARLDRLPRRLDLRRAVADAGAVAAVHQQQRDIGPGLPGFLDEARVGQGEQQQREHPGAQPRAARAAPEGRHQRDRRQGAEGDQQPERQDGGEVDAGDDLVHACRVRQREVLPDRHEHQHCVGGCREGQRRQDRRRYQQQELRAARGRRGATRAGDPGRCA